MVSELSKTTAVQATPGDLRPWWQRWAFRQEGCIIDSGISALLS